MLLVVVVVMLVVGLMIFIGKLIGMFVGDVNVVYIIVCVMEDIGWVIIINLYILFVVVIGGFWVKDCVGGVFVVLLVFVLIN